MSAASVKVLMVEDNPSDARVIERLLGMSRQPLFEVSHADRIATGVEALDRGLGPDVILLDLSLPDSDPETLESFHRVRAAAAGVPIIILTGMRDQELAARAVRMGAQDLLIKGDVDADLLSRALIYAMERQHAEENLRESEERYALAVRGANDGLWDWDLNRELIYYSPRWKAILGCEEDDLSDRPEEWFDRVHPDDLHRLKADIEAHLGSSELPASLFATHFENEHRMRHSDGRYRWVLARGLALRDRGNRAFRMAGSLTDVTMRKSAEERLLHDALHDALTGLPNRALFLDRLGVAIARSRRRSRADEKCTAVLFLDLDRFKHVNDSLGHLSGDRLLVAMARRLQSILRPGDTVARLGGDEFAVLVDIAGVEDTDTVAGRIHSELAVPFNVDGHEVIVTVSLGIAVVAPNYDRPEDLLRDADIAMYQAKSEGRSGHKLFDKQMHTKAAAMLQLEADLSRALNRQELLLHYQPVISLATDRVVGFEALLRWEHPERGLIFPSDIISVAEDTGLIVPIGAWVLEEACRQLVHWRNEFEAARELSMSINLSSKQLMQPDIAEVVTGILDRTGLEASRLRLELTESVLMDNAESAVAKLSRLRKRGVQIHIDDFGTGYSSLSYLQRLPVDTLKIDQTFISQLTLQAESAEIVGAIITLARTLGMSVSAEGVETVEQADGLRELDCELCQGFYYFRPLDGRAVEKLLSN